MSRHIYLLNDQPLNFPTHHLDAEHWEWLGRSIATFGLLEEVLRKAIFAITGATQILNLDEMKNDIENWNKMLGDKVVGVELGGLIKVFEQAATSLASFEVENFFDLVADLQQAKAIRDVLCHASWQVPDSSGLPLPFFVKKKDKQVNQTRMNTAYLRAVQIGTADLICAIMSATTSNGLHFPSTPHQTKSKIE